MDESKKRWTEFKEKFEIDIDGLVGELLLLLNKLLKEEGENCYFEKVSHQPALHLKQGVFDSSIHLRTWIATKGQDYIAMFNMIIFKAQINSKTLFDKNYTVGVNSYTKADLDRIRGELFKEIVVVMKTERLAFR